MRVIAARKWIICSSLVILGGYFVFFGLAPGVGYPLDWEQAKRLYEIVGPVFLGYLGLAAHFNFHRNAAIVDKNANLPRGLVFGPVLVFAAANLVFIISFGYSNRRAAPPGSGMDADTLAFWLAATLGILASVNNFMLPYLFPTGGNGDGN